MTTQNTHSEHNDVDTSVVEYPPAPDSVVDPTTSENEAPATSHDEADATFTESTTTADQQEVTQLETINSSDDTRIPAHEFVDQQNTSVVTVAEAETGPETCAEPIQASSNLPAETPADIIAAPIAEHEGELDATTDTVAETSSEPLTSMETTQAVETDVPSTFQEYSHQQETTTEPTQHRSHEEARENISVSEALVTAFLEEITATQTAKEEQQPAPATAEVEQPENSAEASTSITNTSAENTTIETTTIVEESSTFTYVEAAPLVNTKAEEVRPFTDFIEEFRQAEAARLQTAMQGSSVDAFTRLAPTDVPMVEQILAQEAIIPSSIQNEEGASTTPILESIPDATSDAATEEAVVQPTTETINSSQTTEPIKDETPTEVTRPAPVERAVSPLLRPASRLRIPRHSVRHPREEAIQETLIQAPKPEIAVPSPTEQVAQEAPRPTRRYRFDRPTTAKTPAETPPATPAANRERVEEIRPTTTRTEAPQPVQPEPAASVVQPTEHHSRKQPVVPEPAITESAPIPTPTPADTGRSKRHSHKEQQAAAVTPTPPPAAEVAAINVEQPKPEEIAPEDLPPLEYSELQKASSRRRRRHRSGPGSSATVLPPVAAIAPPGPVIPTPAPVPVPVPIAQAQAMPAPMSLPPVEPMGIANGANNYTIVSGYTVSQMNQGNDMTGPFMGPEPSPARGSIFARDGRTSIRAEAQRTPSQNSPYPARTADNGLTAASLTQFANIVSQSIQTQTDRMVTELRRANQSPTNVSVTLPPFPSTERVGVFVDVANLLYSARTLRMTVDFGKLLDFLRGNRRLVRAHAYCPTSPQAGDEQMFLQAVKGLGYRITTKNYKTFSSGAKKADLDLDLCMDVVRLVDGGAVDCIVLVSGDSDFMPMLDYCSDHGVRVEVAAFDEAMSATLRQSCDLFVNLSLLEEIRG